MTHAKCEPCSISTLLWHARIACACLSSLHMQRPPLPAAGANWKLHACHLPLHGPWHALAYMPCKGTHASLAEAVLHQLASLNKHVLSHKQAAATLACRPLRGRCARLAQDAPPADIHQACTVQTRAETFLARRGMYGPSQAETALHKVSLHKHALATLTCRPHKGQACQSN